ncbi:hypothetical protein LXL04_026246 [Taraxacum kok-saghyz]
MDNGDRNSGGYNIGGVDDYPGEAPTAFLESDMKMQQALSYQMTNFISPSSHYYDNHLHKHQASPEIGSGVVIGSDSGGTTGKMLFTAIQWQELERQTMIYKYIMASIPVPPQLLIPFSTQPNSTFFPYCKTAMDMRFSSGSDPEPWRCRRTDGKKWRCSRDVTPDQKYCERHAHKSRPRSRKPVESQPHNTTITTTSLNSTPSYPHPNWNLPVSSSNQQFQQSINSPRVGSKRNHFHPQEHESHNNYLDTITNTVGGRRQSFIDAWSRSGGGGDNCSLTLSMQCSGAGIDDDEIGVGMLDIEREGSRDVLKSNNQWLNQSSWMCSPSPPGGPLGEALGLGIANGPFNGPSSHGHNSSNSSTAASR